MILNTCERVGELPSKALRLESIGTEASVARQRAGLAGCKLRYDRRRLARSVRGKRQPRSIGADAASARHTGIPKKPQRVTKRLVCQIDEIRVPHARAGICCGVDDTSRHDLNPGMARWHHAGTPARVRRKTSWPSAHKTNVGQRSPTLQIVVDAFPTAILVRSQLAAACRGTCEYARST